MKKDLVIIDVPGVYLNEYIPENKYLFIKFDNKFVDIMCAVSPELVKDVRFEKGKKMLYLKLRKVLYGCIESALLWYTLFLNNLSDLGFKVNPYDKWVTNKKIEGHQCTIVWYVDDVKVSYINKSVIFDKLNYTQQEFGNITISRGNNHKYLGMDIELLNDSRISISMKKHIDELLNMIPGGVKGSTTSPVKKQEMFEINNMSQELDQKCADLFYPAVAKILWITKRRRPDLETAESFLCTRAANPN